MTQTEMESRALRLHRTVLVGRVVGILLLAALAWHLARRGDITLACFIVAGTIVAYIAFRRLLR